MRDRRFRYLFWCLLPIVLFIGFGVIAELLNKFFNINQFVSYLILIIILAITILIIKNWHKWAERIK
jgi:predicted tellurium resistance membrane protein TerC